MISAKRIILTVIRIYTVVLESKRIRCKICTIEFTSQFYIKIGILQSISCSDIVHIMKRASKKSIKPRKENQRIFMDYASTTPVLLEVVRVMAPYHDAQFANPAALYREGLEAKKVIREARQEVATVLGVSSSEIIFTGSGTESDNLALLGVFEAAKKTIVRPHMITTTIEHPAILEVCKEIERRGGEVTCVPVDQSGKIILSELKKALKATTVLVSVMYANNEVGTIQSIAEISKIIRAFKKDTDTPFPYFHTDASQSPNYLSIRVPTLGVDLMTLDGGKIYGPKGVGVFFIKRGVTISPIIYGGGQEQGLRSGTENVPAIVGMAKALVAAVRDRERESERLVVLRDYFITSILEKIPNTSLNGDFIDRLPNNINICFPDSDGEFLVIKLDYEGIACSSSSSCRTLAENSSSYVIEALGKGKACTQSSLRFTLGRGTTKKEVEVVIEKLVKLFAKA